MNARASIAKYRSRSRSRHFDPGHYGRISKQEAEIDGVFVAQHLYLYEVKAGVASSRKDETSTLLTTELAELGRLYSLGDDVTNYLRKYPFLIQILTLAVEPLQKAFGEGYKLSTEIIDEGGRQKLFAVVTTSSRAEAALERLDEFDRSWWFGVPDRVRNFLEFTVDFA